jgi:hypothetical protein
MRKFLFHVFLQQITEYSDYKQQSNVFDNHYI